MFAPILHTQSSTFRRQLPLLSFLAAVLALTIALSHTFDQSPCNATLGSESETGPLHVNTSELYNGIVSELLDSGSCTHTLSLPLIVSCFTTPVISIPFHTTNHQTGPEHRLVLPYPYPNFASYPKPMPSAGHVYSAIMPETATGESSEHARASVPNVIKATFQMSKAADQAYESEIEDEYEKPVVRTTPTKSAFGEIIAQARGGHDAVTQHKKKGVKVMKDEYERLHAQADTLQSIMPTDLHNLTGLSRARKVLQEDNDPQDARRPLGPKDANELSALISMKKRNHQINQTPCVIIRTSSSTGTLMILATTTVPSSPESLVAKKRPKR
jgi:hypothetical protein